MRPLRWIPQDGAWWVVELTVRTVNQLYLLRPSRTLTERTLGVLARAQARSGVRIHHFCYLSNHGHLLVSVRDAEMLSQFMQYTNANLAKEASILHDWSGRFWGRRYRSSVLSQEPLIHAERMKYLLAQGVKEGLVERATDWPGASSAEALSRGEMRMRGAWVDRTALYEGRRAGKDLSEHDVTNEETIELTPLPEWEDEPAHRYAAWIRRLRKEIEDEAALERRIRGVQCLGKRAILAADPHGRPAGHRAKTPAPRFLTASRQAWIELRKAYRMVLDSFLEASERFRAGERGAEFPEGTFPPRPPFQPRLDSG